MLGIVSVSLAVIARVLPVVDVELRYADAVRVGVGPEAGSSGIVTEVVPLVELLPLPKSHTDQEITYVPASQAVGIDIW